MINKVTKKECLEAIDYLWSEGFIQQMRTDEKFYVTKLLKKVANSYKIKLYESKEEALKWVKNKL